MTPFIAIQRLVNSYLTYVNVHITLGNVDGVKYILQKTYR